MILISWDAPAKSRLVEMKCSSSREIKLILLILLNLKAMEFEANTAAKRLMMNEI